MKLQLSQDKIPKHLLKYFKSIGHKKNDLIDTPHLVAEALRQDGWILRQDIIWEKSSCLPESVKNRCANSHEHIFLLVKTPQYYFDYKAIQVQSNQIGNNTIVNKRSVWKIPTSTYKGAHFATFNPKLITPCILAGCPKGRVVFDPFMGAATVGVVAKKNNRKYLGVELNPKYIKLAKQRLRETLPNLF